MGGGGWRPAVLTVDVECNARRVSGLQSQLCTEDDGATLNDLTPQLLNPRLSASDNRTFHTVHVHGVLMARILERFAIPSSIGPCFVRTLHYDPSILGGPAWHGSQLHWVTQAPSP